MLEKEVFFAHLGFLSSAVKRKLSAFVLMASRVADNRHIRKSTKEILRS